MGGVEDGTDRSVFWRTLGISPEIQGVGILTAALAVGTLVVWLCVGAAGLPAWVGAAVALCAFAGCIWCSGLFLPGFPAYFHSSPEADSRLMVARVSAGPWAIVIAMVGVVVAVGIAALGISLVVDRLPSMAFPLFLPLIILLTVLSRWGRSRRATMMAPRRDELLFAVMAGSFAAGTVATAFWAVALGLVYAVGSDWDLGSVLGFAAFVLIGAGLAFGTGIAVTRRAMTAVGVDGSILDRPVPLPRNPLIHASSGGVAGVTSGHLMLLMFALDGMAGPPAGRSLGDVLADAANLLGLPAQPYAGYLMLTVPPALAGALAALWHTRKRTGGS